MATKTVQLSLGSIALLFIVLLAIGMLGGLLGAKMVSAPIPLTPNTNGTIVPVSQQITISPSKTSSDIVATHGKSLFLLGVKTTKGITFESTAIALTSDGVLLSVTAPAKDPMVALGEDGVAVPVTSLGKDELSGLFFYKVSDRIVTPLNLLQSAPSIGSLLLNLSRQQESAHLLAHSTMLSATTIPSELAAPGIQKLGVLEHNEPLPLGSALLDENGNLAGIIVNSETSQALLVLDIRGALERLSSNRLSYNPFASLGFTITWNTEFGTNDTIKITSTVSKIEKASPADTAGLAVGDVLTGISGNTVSWDTDLSSALGAKPLVLTVTRKGEQRTITMPQ